MSGGDDVRYATAPDGGRLAYRVAGRGPIDVLVVASHGAVFSIEAAHDLPRLRYFEESLASFCRLITYDLRGFGLSDPLGAEWPVEQRVADAIAVLDACESEEAALFGTGWGAGMSIEIAAAHPERVHSLVLVNGWVRTMFADDFPIGLSPETWAAEWDAEQFDLNEGATDFDLLAPSLADDGLTRRWWIRGSRRSASPASASAASRWARDVDVRAELEQIALPMLVVESQDNMVTNFGAADWITDHARDAKLVRLAGGDHIAWAMPVDPLIAAIEEFLVGTSVQRSGRGVVLAVLFTDIVDSTRHNVREGDGPWSSLLASHDQVVQREVDLVRGTVVKSMGDGVLATFETPSAALAAAAGIIESTSEIGLHVRAAVHVAEVRLRDDDVFGLGVTIAARALGEASGGQVVVTSTVVDLLEGSDHKFAALGRFALKNIEGERSLYDWRGAGYV
jgi:class 3 adenylate cyclase